VNNIKDLNSLNLRTHDRIVCWGNQIPPELTNTVKSNEVSFLHVEDGFIRSVGLGSDLVRPLSLVFDKKGMYFDATKASDLESILNENDFSEEEVKEAKKLKRLIIQHQITKYNIDSDIKPKWKTSKKKIILVPGQVEDDASIQFGSFWIQNNLELLKEVRIRHPHAYIVYKPHPDVTSGNRTGKIPEDDVLLYADYIERNSSVIRSIEASDEIHTMTSLTGFDALIRGKKVVTYGEPFYAGWGLTIDLYDSGKSFKRRKQKLSLIELMAGVLIRYPIYWDWDLKGYTTCEATILRIIECKKELIDTHQFDKLRIGWVRRQLRKINTLRQAYLPSTIF
jgi:capsular polysaccharide export protein